MLVGPHVHVNSAVIEDGAFLATGAAVFPGAGVGPGSEVRIHAVVHVNSKLASGTPGLLAAEVFDAAGMVLVRDHLRLAHPLAGEHPV